VITLTKDKKTKQVLTKEEYSKELSPDDLDFREDNDLTHEQEKNSEKEKLKDKYNFKGISSSRKISYYMEASKT